MAAMNPWRRAAIVTAVLLAGCLDNSSGPCTQAQCADSTPNGLIVSNPVSFAALALHSRAASPPAVGGSETVYVSLLPGTVPTGMRAAVQRIGDATSLTTAVINGGFDPQPVAAQTGDSIAVSVTDSGGNTVYQDRAAVPLLRPPVVVRTDPPPRKRDVPLNASIVIVFSEPMDSTTVTSSTLALFRGTSATAGSVVLQPGLATNAVFTPGAALAAGTDYQLVVTQGVRDLDGEALAAAVTVDFTTGAGTAPAPISVSVTPVTASLLAGGTQVFTATVANDSGGRGVTWAITGCTGGAVACGSLTTVTSTTATYIAPATVPPNTLSIAATSVSDSSKRFTATVTVSTSAAGTLLTGLEYPQGLWIKDGVVYLTETAGRNTSFGGKVRLSRYVLASGLLETLIDNPQNSDAVVVDSAGKIYLTSYKVTLPGENGDVSVAQLQGGQWVESNLLHLAIGSTDMFLDANQDIYVFGSSDLSTASSLYLLRSPNYSANPSVVTTGLGRGAGLTKIGSDIYYSRFVVGGRTSRQVRRLRGGTDQLVIDSVIVTSLTSDGTFLYYAAGFEPGRIDRMNLTTGVIETIVGGLGNPNAVRFDASSRRLYFLEGGTQSAEYKNGALKVITNLP